MPQVKQDMDGRASFSMRRLTPDRCLPQTSPRRRNVARRSHLVRFGPRFGRRGFLRRGGRERNPVHLRDVVRKLLGRAGQRADIAFRDREQIVKYFAEICHGAAPLSPASAIERIERLVEKELAIEETARAALGPLPRPPADAERAARTLSTLTQTLHALTRLRGGLSPETESNDDDDMPRDIDEFRNELARRIIAFVESRRGDRPADAGGDAARVDTVR